MLRLIADLHERASGVPERLVEAGVHVEVERRAAGDYAIGGGAIVERKTVRGLHASVLDGTFWPQLGRLRQRARFPCLLLEGADLDDGPLAPGSIRGLCIAVTDLGCVLLRSTGAGDSALWLRILAERRQAGVPRARPYAKRPKAGTSSPPEAALAAVPGISGVMARTLVEHFGTLAAVVEAEETGLRRVPGIGPTRAASLIATFRLPPTPSHSRLCRERRGPAT